MGGNAIRDQRKVRPMGLAASSQPPREEKSRHMPGVISTLEQPWLRYSIFSRKGSEFSYFGFGKTMIIGKPTLIKGLCYYSTRTVHEDIFLSNVLACEKSGEPPVEPHRSGILL